MMHHSVLLNKADKFLRDGLAASSRTTYAAGQGRYIHFCNTAKVPATPATEYTLILFITHLASTNICYATIKVYLSAIRHMHVYRGWHNHFNQQLTPRLQLILRGIRKHQSSTHVPRVRLPITVQILHSIRRLLSQKPKSYATTMLWVACSLAFFAFLRVSEFTNVSLTHHGLLCIHTTVSLGERSPLVSGPPFYGLRKRIWMIELAQAPNSSSPKYLFVNTINILSFDLKVGTKEFFSPPGQSRLGTFTKSPPQSSACGGYYIDKLLTDGQSTLHKELTLNRV